MTITKERKAKRASQNKLGELQTRLTGIKDQIAAANVRLEAIQSEINSAGTSGNVLADSRAEAEARSRLSTEREGLRNAIAILGQQQRETESAIKAEQERKFYEASEAQNAKAIAQMQAAEAQLDIAVAELRRALDKVLEIGRDNQANNRTLLAAKIKHGDFAGFTNAKATGGLLKSGAAISLPKLVRKVEGREQLHYEFIFSLEAEDYPTQF